MNAIKKIISIITCQLLWLPAYADDAQPCAYSKVSNTAKHFTSCWYVGGSYGLTHVDPEGESNGWSTDDDSSDGYAIYVGQHFVPRAFWELKYLDAGEAGLGNRNPLLDRAVSDAAIDYKIPSLMVGYFLFGDERKLNFYGKVGLSAIKTKSTDSRINYDPQSTVQIAYGLGAQYRSQHSPWFFRVEFDRYDRDATQISIAVARYFNWGNN